MTLADRLRARGIQDPGGFVAWAQPAAWAQAAGYRAPLEGLDDRELDGLVDAYRQAVGSPAARRLPAPTMTPELAHQLVEQGAARHRARLAIEQIVRQVLAERTRVKPLRETCPKCSATSRCWEHER